MNTGWIGWCETHQKRLFTKKGAQRAKRTLRDPGLRKYRCRGEYWHIGHLPRDVKEGRKTAKEIFKDNP